MSGSLRGEINGWRCLNEIAGMKMDRPACDGITYAIHVDDGVTPMFLGCRATEGCSGTGVSLMYPAPPVPKHVLDAVAWEWYRPIGRELVELNEGEAQYVKNGGLLIRPLTDAGLELLKELR